ncbi:MAG: rod shape-determining protein MreC [Anaerolineae bacterium]|nr:rod shape-determining protein MreC [Anaerolineae bacterium]
MLRFVERSWLLVVLIGLALAGYGLHQAGRLAPVQRAASDVFAVAQGPLTAVSGRATGVIDSVRRFEAMDQENADLRAEVARLAVENLRLTEAAAENVRLREAVGFKEANPALTILGAEVIERGGQGLVTGRVVSRDPSPYLSQLTINVGRRDGVKEGMPVVTPQGLVGRISRVGDRTARVLLLTDTASAVNAKTMRGRVTGVVEGAEEGRLALRFVEQGAELKVGDIVLTSGLGGSFPAGQPIGQVTAVRQKDIDLFQDADVRPIVDFSRLEEVLVITGFEATPVETAR